MPGGLLRDFLTSAFDDLLGPGLADHCPATSSSSPAATAVAADHFLHAAAQNHDGLLTGSTMLGHRPKAARTAFAAAPMAGPAAVEVPPRMEEQWLNTSGLPDVSEMTASPEFYSPDMADSLQGSQFKPTFGCKCGDWVPALSHPELEFKAGFLQSHPDFQQRLRTIHVHMDDITANKVHWDATYDLRKYRQAGQRLRLNETTPHEAEGGTQLRFMTFCPPKGGASHQYVLKVSAYDDKGEPIDYLQDKSAMYIAKPPKDHQPTKAPNAAAGHGKGPHTDKNADASGKGKEDGTNAEAKPDPSKDAGKDAGNNTAKPEPAKM
mmetsp:Transcript_49330/g.104935  ORF Transcript_49330/g.104935 Transcript_49330/m.104935 type:complete len:322 (+) Transcript_49330:296-1261(+)